jgi:hypothetical protein
MGFSRCVKVNRQLFGHGFYARKEKEERDKNGAGKAWVSIQRSEVSWVLTA